MSVPQKGGEPISGRDDLVRYLEAGNKPPSKFRIGTEHEKFGFRRADNSPIPYAGPAGIRAMLEGLTEFGWEPILEGENIIGLKQGEGAISLEPGGQLELSGAPLENLHQTCEEVHQHLHQVETIGRRLGLGFLGVGSSPKWSREETPVMPKGRYDIMRRYMPKKGKRGLDMMLRTTTIQANLDYSSEADMVKKVRVGLALQPIATALFASSPFLDGKPTGNLSERSAIWLDTDPDRTGMLPFAFDKGFGFEAYVDYALKVPMYFIYRDGRYHDVAGQSFKDFLAGELPGHEGARPLMSDWADHLTTLFPEVRVKTFIEMRGADGGPWARICALPAFWVGLIYDGAALDAAWDLVKGWTAQERQALREAVPGRALQAEIRGRKVLDIARDVVAISRAGLIARARGDKSANEAIFLDPLFETLDRGRTHAEEMLKKYEGPWRRSVEPAFEEYAY
jgi:glutamate--cysteine ligase